MNYKSKLDLLKNVNLVCKRFEEEGVTPALLVTALQASSIQNAFISVNAAQMSRMPNAGGQEDMRTLFTLQQTTPSYMEDLGFKRGAHETTLRELDSIASPRGWPMVEPEGLEGDLKAFNPGPVNIAVACLRPFVIHAAAIESGPLASTQKTLVDSRNVTREIYCDVMTSKNGDAAYPFLRRVAAGLAQMQPVNSVNFTQAVQKVLRIDPNEQMVRQGKFLQSLGR